MAGKRKSKTTYLSYVEETPKQYKQLEDIAKEASREAVISAKNQNIAITYAEGEDIIREDAKGNKVIVGHIPARLKVKKGERISLS